MSSAAEESSCGKLHNHHRGDRLRVFRAHDNGITKALNKCPPELRPQLPSADAPVRMSFVPRYCDDELPMVVANVGDGTDPLTLVLTKDEAAVEVAKRRRG